MAEYSFTLVVDGGDLDEDQADAIYGSGLDDATITTVAGWQLIEVDRDAPSYGQALFSALRQLRDAAPGVRVLRVEPDGLASIQDIADRTGRSRESVRLLMSAERGPGGFPPPVVRATGRSRLWSIRDVAYWFAEHLGQTALLDSLGREILALNAAVNARLEEQRALAGVDPEDREALEDWLLSAERS